MKALTVQQLGAARCKLLPLEDYIQNILTMCVCGPQPSWSGDLLCFGNDQTDKNICTQIICQCSEPCQANLRLAQPLKKSLKARVLFHSY